jgi:hypothetical protein
MVKKEFIFAGYDNSKDGAASNLRRLLEYYDIEYEKLCCKKKQWIPFLYNRY